ncbi:PAT complex subunit CCDC47-like [Tubulanus polymorphus]|uniref:PAT complex subunit CCDC47-like n=1 Tax=Tubulanus polymorphus TaxID=672921 RepID=UPI003DA3238A
MKHLYLVVIALALLVKVTMVTSAHEAEVEDNEFAEFEDFDEDEVVKKPAPSAQKTEKKSGSESPSAAAGDDEQQTQPKIKPSAGKTVDSATTDEDEATVENEEDEFDHFNDEEEFEGFDKESKTSKIGKGGQEKIPDLKITKVPLHLRTNWDSFYLEMMMLGGLAVYFLNFLAGKAKNQKLAQAWMSAHKELLEANFHIVGDDGQAKEVTSGVLMKESENVYTLWCSGRVCCEGMLVELRLLKRQDLVNTIARMMKPVSDQIMIKVTMDATDMDTFVMCLAQKKMAAKLQKEMNDLSLFCPDIKKNSEKYGLSSSSYHIMAEIPEVTPAILDTTVCAVLNKFEGIVEYIHISDQFSGPKQTDDSGAPTKMPEVEKVLQFCFNIPKKGNTNVKDMEEMKPFLKLVFHCMDKVRRIKLTKEAKQRAERNRQKIEESYLKATHSTRQEAAQARREEKKRSEKEKMMNEEDPDKQRKWEDRENRREMKRKQPRMKMMKMKAM